MSGYSQPQPGAYRNDTAFYQQPPDKQTPANSNPMIPVPTTAYQYSSVNGSPNIWNTANGYMVNGAPPIAERQPSVPGNPLSIPPWKDANYLGTPPTGAGIAGSQAMGGSITGPAIQQQQVPMMPFLRPPSTQPQKVDQLPSPYPPTSVNSFPPFAQHQQGMPPNSIRPQLPPTVGSPVAPAYQQPQQSGSFQTGIAPSQKYPAQLPSGNFAQSSAQPSYVDLLQEKTVIGDGRNLGQMSISLPSSVENHTTNCDQSVFRCTLSVVPQNQELLKRCRLPFGISLHPFRDLPNLNVIQSTTIVRCRSCRTYINPFVQFVDQRRWKCNLCYRINDVPDEFCWDPKSKSFGEPNRRPEIRYATVEYIAPQEYMLRPPQPACYVFIMDVSIAAVESGYLHVFCDRLASNLDKLPGTADTLIAFITVDAALHFYEFNGEQPQLPPKQLIVSDLDDVFLPSEQGLLVRLDDYRESVKTFVRSLPSMFNEGSTKSNAVGAAVTIAHQLIAAIGGRISVIQASLPDVGPGSLQSREDPNLRAANEVGNIGPANDFYKRLALECSGHQVAIDLIMINSVYADVATLSEMSKYCGGCVYSYPNLHLLRNAVEVERFKRGITRYLTRKIGFEAVLRIRCTKGLTLQSFYGNFFVRSTDLLALPNANPDTAIGAQVAMDESVIDSQVACFQAALLYTSHRGDRRIRVHTLCIPISNQLSDIYSGVDIVAVMSLLSKLAADRASATNSIRDAKEALINGCIDSIGAFSASIRLKSQKGVIPGLPAPIGHYLKLMPLMTMGLLKHPAFSTGTSLKLDNRVYLINQFRTLPMDIIFLEIYPALFPVHSTILESAAPFDPPRLQLSFERVDRDGIYFMDAGSYMFLYIGQSVADALCQSLFNVANFASIDEDSIDLWSIGTAASKSLVKFIDARNSWRSFQSPLKIIREDSPFREMFVKRLIEDKTESSNSYVEFLHYLKKEIAK